MGTLTFASLGWAVLLDTGIAAASVFAFNTLRTAAHVGTRPFYSPKRRLSIPLRQKPPRLSSVFFLKGGFYRALWLDDVTFSKIAGHDALAYVRFLSLGAPTHHVHCSPRMRAAACQAAPLPPPAVRALEGVRCEQRHCVPSKPRALL